MLSNLYTIIIMAFTQQDTECMSLALKLSELGRASVGANPMVGCVITRDNEIIAEDFHRQYGEGHAEINALEQINHEAKNTSLYVTLEPCSHHGKTPPCADALIKAGVKKVIIAMLDPNPLVSGRGVKMLQDANIQVEVGLLKDEASKLNRGFIKRMRTGMPFVTSKIAMSLDGRTAMKMRLIPKPNIFDVTKEDIANMAVFLLSDNAHKTNGQVMTIDGFTERMN